MKIIITVPANVFDRFDGRFNCNNFGGEGRINNCFPNCVEFANTFDCDPTFDNKAIGI